MTMKYRQLGNSEIKVSVICLGTMTWGEQNTQAQAFEQMDYALDEGVNFFDTAEMYPVPPQANTYAETERIIGNWLEATANREKIVLATKVASRSESFHYIRDGQPKLDTKNIKDALHASLKRLKTDYVDLYQLHWPDRQTNYFGQLGYQHIEEESVELLESLQALADLVREGKVRHIGVSNETPWGVMQMLRLAEMYNLPRIVSIQNPYSLLNRTYEVGLAEISHREKVGLLAYSPMAFGALSGKYLHGSHPEHGRLTLYERFTRYSNPLGICAIEDYVEIANRHQLSAAQMSLAYVNSRDFLTSTIIGATTLDQLKENIASINVTLSDNSLQTKRHDEHEIIHYRYFLPF